jgi:hypothetical protein
MLRFRLPRDNGAGEVKRAGTGVRVNVLATLASAGRREGEGEGVAEGEEEGEEGEKGIIFKEDEEEGGGSGLVERRVEGDDAGRVWEGRLWRG